MVWQGKAGAICGGGLGDPCAANVSHRSGLFFSWSSSSLAAATDEQNYPFVLLL